MPSDLDIALEAGMKPLADLAGGMGVGGHLLEPYGESVAKISLDALDELASRPMGRYVLVSAITPTPLGEGKTTTVVGLGQAFQYLGRSATVAIRQPSMGPTFGIKGGAAGAGYSQVVPMDRLNLHLTGDFHAVTAAHNLLAAIVDNHLYHGNPLGLDPVHVTWRRVLDVNDRALRNVVIGLGDHQDGVPPDRVRHHRGVGGDGDSGACILAVGHAHPARPGRRGLYPRRRTGHRRTAGRGRRDGRDPS
jgi:formate--tetrahydrofolate ligase